jgi:hypothetical protein
LPRSADTAPPFSPVDWFLPQIGCPRPHRSLIDWVRGGPSCLELVWYLTGSGRVGVWVPGVGPKKAAGSSKN